MYSLLTLLAAHAQVDTPEANGQLFRPSIDATHTLWTTDTGRAPDGYVLARGVFHYANRPVVFVDDAGDTLPIVSDVLQMSVLAGYSRGPVRLGLDVPVYLYTDGLEGGEAGLGDVGFDGKLTVLDRTTKPVGLALTARVTFPSTTVDAALGSRGFGWELVGLADKEVGRLLLVANLGTRGVPRAELDNFTWGDQLLARVGVGYELSSDAGLSADVGSNINYANIVPGSTPAEAILGGWARIEESVVLRGGVGSGITTGFGAPRFRAVFAVAYEPRRDADADGDGILDLDDHCETSPEDVDQHEDLDGCPEPTPLTVRLVDPSGTSIEGRWTLDGPQAANGQAGSEVEVPGGTYVLEAFAEGYADLSQQVEVPDGPGHEVTLTLEAAVEPSFLSVVVNDGQGAAIDGATWSVVGEDGHRQPGEVEIQPGEIEVRAAADGYRAAKQTVTVEMGETGQLVFALAEARTTVTVDRIEIKDSIYFETDKAVIKTESHDLLDEVAEVLIAHDELLRIRIEGHTDSRGTAAYNRKLSQDRAESVKAYLVDRGVAEERLDTAGFGESKPLVEGNDSQAWANNRRVDFFVVERSD